MIKTDTYNLLDNIPPGYRGEVEVTIDNAFEEIGGYYGVPPSGTIVISLTDEGVSVLRTVDLGQATEVWACHAIPAIIRVMGILT